MDERELPTRGEIAAAICRGYGGALIIFSLRGLIASGVILLRGRPAASIAPVVRYWTLISSAEVFCVGLLLLVLGRSIAGEMTGEIEFADRRPLVREDMVPLSSACFGLFCLVNAINSDVNLVMQTFAAPGSLLNDWLGNALLLTINIGGFALAFRDGIRRRFAPSQTR